MKIELIASAPRGLSFILHPSSLILVCCLVATAPVAMAQESKGALPALAQHEGANRMQRLIDGARREGVLNLYTSLTVDDMAALNGAFEGRYGVKVRMWRASSEKVVQRAVAEAKAGRHEMDVVECNAPALEMLRREGLLQAVRSPHHADLIPTAVPAHREWVGARLNIFVQAYNTRLVKKEELPASFTAEQLRQKGAPLDWFVLPPAIARANGVAVARRATNVHAALLYYDFMIGEEGQQILLKRDFVPASKKADTRLNQGPLTIIDPAFIVDQGERWAKLYDEIIVKGNK